VPTRPLLYEIDEGLRSGEHRFEMVTIKKEVACHIRNAGVSNKAWRHASPFLRRFLDCVGTPLAKLVLMVS
jgi:hypothetical protein